MSTAEQLKYDFELDNIDKPLSKSDLSQKLQDAKENARLSHCLSNSDTRYAFSVVSIFLIPLILIYIALCAFVFIPDFIEGKIQIIDIIKEAILFSSPVILGYIMIIIYIIIIFISCKKHVKDIETNSNHVFNKELNQLNNCLVNKNEQFEVRYLHELIKENKYITYHTIINDDNTAHLIIEVDNKFKKLDRNDYSDQDLELINQYNTHYKLNTNKDALHFFEQNVNQHIDKDKLNSRFDAQSLQELHDKTEKIKNLAQRN